ncbi:MAG: 5-(carboxyamino)imidazole ribonucleotide mutase [Candidatus Edwardsbacteria bacterium]|nr:5-(carboxyamino)imidazole ribonucleotide mutase [Candidatus Edwardsbacteria bacterium]MBU1575810.1 5-(carboxyamino)imidazole ribonucleotide mutase [Candidatus Edwardsbacteria bacterium]MBU2463973.1 5-(carboxyamino)imidazole ribonucleotide mutase [Candidatus Edwardsbacteria bacterium]MBU2593271.1 5-(carboxyamino)imidazole ribonucleotide mutase [Candidatus Edwardsbacteria bacterium]
MPDIKVAVLMGSDSDLPVMEKAIETLKEFGIKPQVKILSAHRLPDKVAGFCKEARSSGFEVIIAGAGLAAHLAGAVAANTTLPVIGVPLKSGALAGVDALYATVQMPSGIPVATVAIDGAKNAAILAAEILSIKYPDIAQKLEDMRARMRQEVEKKSAQAEQKYNQ